MKLSDAQAATYAERVYARWFADSGNESDMRALAEEFRNLGPAKRNRLIYAIRSIVEDATIHAT